MKFQSFQNWCTICSKISNRSKIRVKDPRLKSSSPIKKTVTRIKKRLMNQRKRSEEERIENGAKSTVMRKISMMMIMKLKTCLL